MRLDYNKKKNSNIFTFKTIKNIKFRSYNKFNFYKYISYNLFYNLKRLFKDIRYINTKKAIYNIINLI